MGNPPGIVPWLWNDDALTSALRNSPTLALQPLKPWRLKRRRRVASEEEEEAITS